MATNFQETTEISAQKTKIINFATILLMDYFYILAFALSVLIVVLGFFLLVKPKYDAIQVDIADKLQARQREKADMQDYLLNLNKYKKAFFSISDEEKQKIDTMVGENTETADLFREIEAIISRQGMVVTGIKVNKMSETPAEGFPAELGKVQVELTVIGADYKSMKNLLAVFENSLKIMDVEKLDYTASDSVTFTVNKYFWKKS